MDQQGANFTGWALLELFGHQREAGYVTTQYFGDKAMFQVDVPEIPEREETLRAPRYIDGKFCPEGTVVRGETIPGRTRLVNPGAVYAMNPATEEAVRLAISRNERREIKVLSLPERQQITAGLPGEVDEDGCDTTEDDE